MAMHRSVSHHLRLSAFKHLNTLFHSNTYARAHSDKTHLKMRPAAVQTRIAHVTLTSQAELGVFRRPFMRWVCGCVCVRARLFLVRRSRSSILAC